MDAAHKLAIAARIVRSPTPALRWEKILTAELGTYVLGRNRHSRYSESAEAPIIVTAAARWVFVICESCEVKLRWIGRTVGEDRGQPDKAASTGEQQEQKESCPFHTSRILLAVPLCSN